MQSRVVRLLLVTMCMCGLYLLSTVSPSMAGGPVWQYDALVIGVPLEDVTGARDAGIVQVIHGSTSGLVTTDHEIKYQDLAGVEDESEIEDRFGYAVAGGDFNGDGYPDLAVGVPWEDVRVQLGFIYQTVQDAGAVHVFYGTASGLNGANTVWTRADFVSAVSMRADERFGTSLTVGDFNGDGYDDLAVGIPHSDVNLLTDAGAVRIIYGSAGGLRTSGSQYLNQADYFPNAAAEAGDRFGWAVAAGDFDGDGYDDLAIGVPFEDTPQGTDVGIVNVIYGSRTGLTSGRTQAWWQGRDDINALAEAGDIFGYALSTGDFNGDGYDDLAVGVPWEDIGSTSNAGAVNVIYGSTRGLSAQGHQSWYQGLGAVQDAAEKNDAFGRSLTSGDFNGDGYDDLAVGVPYEDVGAVQDAGAVAVIYGHASGLRDTGNQLWHQGSPGIVGVVEAGDWFGFTLTSGDFNGDGYADLGIGVPSEDIDDQQDAGGVNVIYGAAGGLRATGNQGWDQKRLPGVAAEPLDRFGYALAVLKATPRYNYFPLIWKAR